MVNFVLVIEAVNPLKFGVVELPGLHALSEYDSTFVHLSYLLVVSAKKFFHVFKVAIARLKALFLSVVRLSVKLSIPSFPVTKVSQKHIQGFEEELSRLYCSKVEITVTSH